MRSTIWLIALVGLVVWQVAQAIAIGAVGIPGVYTVALVSEPPASADASAARTPAVPEQAYRKRVQLVPERKPAPEPEGAAPQPTTPPAPEAEALPPAAELEGWIRATALEFAGGVDAQGNILYRFEFWLEAPAEVRRRLVEVAYDYDAPSVQPDRRQSSDKRQDGFRVRFGALSCVGALTLTLTYDDGRSQRITADGCGVL